jgi:hypothetical protein
MLVFKQFFTFLKCIVPLDFMKPEASKPLQGDMLHPQLKLDLDQA